VCASMCVLHVCAKARQPLCDGGGSQITRANAFVKVLGHKLEAIWENIKLDPFFILNRSEI
jgi:hypothetical protein